MSTLEQHLDRAMEQLSKCPWLLRQHEFRTEADYKEAKELLYHVGMTIKEIQKMINKTH